MPDSSDVDAALVATLRADSELMTLMPDGVFMDEAGKSIVSGGNAKRFVLVSLVDEHDEPMLGGRAFEDAVYLVKAVALSVINGAPLPSTTMQAAAARIDALFDPQPPLPPATLTIAGYGLMVIHRESRVRSTEVDEVDSSIRWQHRGGRYQVMVAPT